MRKLPVLCSFLLLSALTAGCGGSGSSGFDISAARENLAIDGVLQSGECNAEGPLTICPTADDALTGPAPGQPPPLDGPLIDTAPGEDAPRELRCISPDDAPVCSLRIAFTAIGLPDGTAYRVAARADAEGRWTVGPPPQVLGPQFFEAAVDVPPDTVALQLAVLAFVTVEPPDPGETETLAATGAELAFVERIAVSGFE